MNLAGAAHLAALCIAVPLIASAVLMPFSKVMPRWLTCATASLTSLAVAGMSLRLMLYALAHGAIVQWMGGWTPHHGLAIGISFAVDPIGAGLTAFIAFLVFIATMYTWRGFDLVGTLFHSLLMAFLAAMCGYALTGDMFNMFVWFELMTAAAIALTAHKIEEAEAITGAINLAITNTIAGFTVLLGIALLYGRTDALNLAQIGQTLAQRPADALVLASFALIVAGYFVKGAVAPFHFWLDDAHAVAPTPICILFSGIMVQVALYGVARIYWTVYSGALAPDVHALKALFIGVGIATALVGAIMAYAQRHLKRLLAFSTVSHSGMFVAALGLFSAAGVAAAAIFILAHGLIKSALFVCAGNYLNRFKSLDEEELGGKGKEAPLNSALFLIGGAALAGVPPFAISAAKVLYDAAMKDRALFWCAMFMAFASLIDAGAVLRAGIHITWGIGKAQKTGVSPRYEETECDGERLERTPWPMLAAPVLLLAVAVWVGVYGPLWHEISRAAQAFVNRDWYVAAVLHGAHSPLPTAPPDVRTAEDIAINLGVTLAAVIAAFIGLFRGRLPQLLQPVLGPPLKQLRGLHSGIFTDYVTYMIFGITAYAMWLVLSAR